MVEGLGQSQNVFKISILLALQLFIASWNNVTEATVVNVSGKEGFTEKSRMIQLLKIVIVVKDPQELSKAYVVDIDSRLTTKDAPTVRS